LDRRLVVGAIAGTALAGCQAFLGSLSQCQTDTDCASYGPTVMCQGNLCVRDPRCSTVGATDAGAVMFGALFPMTTDGTTPDPNGPSWRNGLQLVVDQLNPPVQQGISGRPLGLVVCDTVSDPVQAHALAQRMVGEGLQALMSAGSSETLNVADVTIPAGVLLVSGYSQSPEVTYLSASPNGVRLVWRTIAPDQYIVGVVVEEVTPHGADAGALPRVAALPRNDAYGQGFYALFSPAYAGPEQAFFFDPSGSQDATELSSAAAYAPGVAVFWAFPNDHVRLLNAIATTPGDAALRSASWYFDDQILVPGVLQQLSHPGEMEGAHSIAAETFDPASPAFAWLEQEYQSRYGVDPGQTPSLASYADAMMLLAVAAGANAVEGNPLDGTHLAQVWGRVSAVDAGPQIPLDPPHFTAALSALGGGQDIDVQGASGPLNFDAGVGEAASNIDVLQVIDGGFTVVKTVYP
jgi:ABC-type branched-subunit amino acid transport system substrate-binding protein